MLRCEHWTFRRVGHISTKDRRESREHRMYEAKTVSSVSGTRDYYCFCFGFLIFELWMHGMCVKRTDVIVDTLASRARNASNANIQQRTVCLHFILFAFVNVLLVIWWLGAVGRECAVCSAYIREVDWMGWWVFGSMCYANSFHILCILWLSNGFDAASNG